MSSQRNPSSLRIPPARGERQAGITLLELALYTVLLALVGAPVVSVFLVASAAMAENDTFNKTAERNRVVLQRVSADVRTAISTTVNVWNGGRWLTLTQAVGFDGAGPIPGNVIRYELDLARGETANGADDNGNRLSDEGELVRRDVTAGSAVTIAGGIDLDQSSFSLAGTAVTLELTTAGVLVSDQSVHSVTRSVTVRPRN